MKSISAEKPYNAKAMSIVNSRKMIATNLLHKNLDKIFIDSVIPNVSGFEPICLSNQNKS